MNRRQTGVVTALALCALVLGALVSRRVYFRLDLSAGQSHTLSKVSKELYREISDQITITYYRSERLARSHPVPGEIEDLLREYVAHSRGRIRLVVRDPALSGNAAAIERLGIEPRQIQTYEQDQAGAATVYTGLTVEYLDAVEVMPTVFSAEGLEYDLSARIRSLVRRRPREAGVIVAASDKSWQEDFPYFAQALARSGYRIRLFSAGEEIPDALPVLFVFGGAEELDSWALYRLDRYLSRGGRLLFALEGVFVDSRGDLAARPVEDSGLLSMLASYGARVETALLLDRAALAVPYQYLGPEGVLQTRLMRYPHWPAVQAELGNPEHPIGASFAGIDLFWPSPITLDPPEGVRSEVLARSTDGAWLMTKDFATSPEQESSFGREAAGTAGSYVLAAALTGTFPQYFRDKPKPVRPGSGESLPELPPAPAAGRVVVIGDGDLAGTLIQYTRSERNLEFLLRAADWLSGDDDLQAIRNRQSSLGRLDRIRDDGRRARAALFARTLSTVLVPAAVVLFGLLRHLRRRSSGRAKDGSRGL